VVATYRARAIRGFVDTLLAYRKRRLGKETMSEHEHNHEGFTINEKEFELLGGAVLLATAGAYVEWQADENDLALQFIANDYRDLLNKLAPYSNIIQSTFTSDEFTRNINKQIEERKAQKAQEAQG